MKIRLPKVAKGAVTNAPKNAERYVTLLLSVSGKNFVATVREAMNSVIPKASPIPKISDGRLFPNVIMTTPVADSTQQPRDTTSALTPRIIMERMNVTSGMVP